MPKRNADVLEVLIGQMSEYRNIYFVIGKTLHVLGQAKLFEPICDLLHWRPPADLTLSVPDREDRKSTMRALLLQRPREGLRCQCQLMPKCAFASKIISPQDPCGVS